MLSKWLNKPPLGVPLIPGHPQLDGLVWWSAFQESAGGIVYNLVDPTGDTDGTLNNFAFPATASSGWNQGKFGRTLAYDGANDYVDIGDHTYCEHFSLSAWIFKTNAGLHTLLAKGNVGVTQLEYYFRVGGENSSGFTTADSVYVDFTTADVSLHIWHHVVMTYDGIILQYYVDGKLINAENNTGTPQNLSNTGRIGRLGDADLQYFPGTIDDVRIYNRALTEAEIQDIYENPFRAFYTMDVALLAQLGIPMFKVNSALVNAGLTSGGLIG